VFLCRDEFQAGFFVRMNSICGPVDVWAVSGKFEDQMIDNGCGFFYFPGQIPAGQVTLTEWPSPDSAPADGPSRARKGQKTPPNPARPVLGSANRSQDPAPRISEIEGHRPLILTKQAFQGHSPFA
jgi:hypothetical protein